MAKLGTYPSLADVGDLLGLSDHDRVRLLTSVLYNSHAAIPAGLRERQLARASPTYRGAPWCDFLAFSTDDDGAGARERFGQVRALLRLEAGNIAIVAELARTGVADGSAASRGCTHLRWACRESPVAVDGHVRLLRAPMWDCHRIVHVVLDFSDLVLRRGAGAIPAELVGTVSVVREKRVV